MGGVDAVKGTTDRRHSRRGARSRDRPGRGPDPAAQPDRRGSGHRGPESGLRSDQLPVPGHHRLRRRPAEERGQRPQHPAGRPVPPHRGLEPHLQDDPSHRDHAQLHGRREHDGARKRDGHGIPVARPSRGGDLGRRPRGHLPDRDLAAARLPVDMGARPLGRTPGHARPVGAGRAREQRLVGRRSEVEHLPAPVLRELQLPERLVPDDGSHHHGELGGAVRAAMGRSVRGGRRPDRLDRAPSLQPHRPGLLPSRSGPTWARTGPSA